jgi:hypothetical protein
MAGTHSIPSYCASRPARDLSCHLGEQGLLLPRAALGDGGLPGGGADGDAQHVLIAGEGQPAFQGGGRILEGEGDGGGVLVLHHADVLDDLAFRGPELPHRHPAARTGKVKGGLSLAVLLVGQGFIGGGKPELDGFPPAGLQHLDLLQQARHALRTHGQGERQQAQHRRGATYGEAKAQAHQSLRFAGS